MKCQTPSCQKKATWEVSYWPKNKILACDEHVGETLSPSFKNTVLRLLSENVLSALDSQDIKR